MYEPKRKKNITFDPSKIQLAYTPEQSRRDMTEKGWKRR